MLYRRLLGVLLLACALAAVAVPPRFRDVKVYTISTVAPGMPGKIAAETSFRNEGTAPYTVRATLAASKALGFAGANFGPKTVAPGASASWKWSFTPPAEVARTILIGTIDLNGATDRDLFIAVEGADPAGFTSKDVEKITERARVVATYAPRTPAAVAAAVKALPPAPKPLLTLAANGKSDYLIVTPGLTPTDDLKAAIADLQRCIKVQSGAEIPYTALGDGPKGIILRQADLGAAAKGLYGAYRLKTEGQHVVIEAADQDGLCNGIYGLLTDHLDCHWFQPRQLGEEIGIPKDRTVRVPALNEVKGSHWCSTNGASWGNAPRWDRQNRAVINHNRMSFGHSWQGYINKSLYPYDKFPQYYARDREGKVRVFDNGWSHTNFCTTNPEVIEIVAKKINDYFRHDPNAIVASLDPNDYAPMCLCDNCLALDRQYGHTKDDGTEVSDRLLRFSQEIYDRLEPQFKNRFLGILVYGFQMDLPKTVKPHDHHAGTICDMPWQYDHTRPWNDPTSAKNREFHRQLVGWGAQLKQFGYYDYYGHWDFFGPWAMVHKMREDLPAFRDAGGTYLMLECQPIFAGQGVNHYIATRLVWDVDADVDLLLEEFFRRYYGPAAEPMRQYWAYAEKCYALERPGSNVHGRVAIRPEFWKVLDQRLQVAERLTAKLPADQQRFKDRVQLARVGFDYGFFAGQYEYNFASYAKALNRPIDHAAAVQYLTDHRKTIEAMYAKYSPSSEYWPTLLPGYFQLSFDALIKQHREAAEKAK